MLYAQSDLRTTKHRNIEIDLGNKIKTNAQLTYPAIGKGHEFYPSTQRLTQHGPIEQYVLGDLYSWLEAHSGLTSLSTR
jgi:hypothetical protein